MHSRHCMAMRESLGGPMKIAKTHSAWLVLVGEHHLEKLHARATLRGRPAEREIERVCHMNSNRFRHCLPL